MVNSTVLFDYSLIIIGHGVWKSNYAAHDAPYSQIIRLSESPRKKNISGLKNLVAGGLDCGEEGRGGGGRRGNCRVRLRVGNNLIQNFQC